MVPVTVLSDLPTLYNIMFKTPHIACFGITDVVSMVMPLRQQVERIRVNMNLDINIDMI